MTFSLAGAGSALAMSESSLQASSGSITAALGDDAKLETFGRNLRGEGPSEALWAASSIQISGGRKLTGMLAGEATAAPTDSARLTASNSFFAPVLEICP